MSINSLTLEWFLRLGRNGLFHGAELLELGPQDLIASRGAIEGSLGDSFTPDNLDLRSSLLGGLSDPGCRGGKEQFSNSSNDKTRALYQVLGVKEYLSLDAFDRRADYVQDLNYEFDLGRRFDIITDFGTSEHCFNIQNVFRMIDRHLKDDGVALFVLPAFGNIDHGFWNVHPNVYKNFALANEYIIEDFIYIDDVATRVAAFEKSFNRPFDFDSLPINPSLKVSPAEIQSLYYENLRAKMGRQESLTSGENERLDYASLAVFDYCLVALRKRKRKAGFRFPCQEEYDVSPYLNAIRALPPEVREIILVPAGQLSRALVLHQEVRDRFGRIVFVDNYKKGEKISGFDVVGEEEIRSVDIENVLIVHSEKSLVDRFSEIFFDMDKKILNHA